MIKEFEKLITDLKKLDFDLFQKDFLLTWEKSKDDLLAILKIAQALKLLHKKNISTKVFDSGLAVSVFRDKSTRTRFSFASAANLLGLAVQDLDEEKSQIAHGETVRETANMISFLSDIIGIRDDMYLGMGNSYMKEVASALEDGFRNQVLNQRPGVINLQCDLDHPTQSMSDLLHLINHFGSVEKLRGKKIAMSWAYSPSYGKPLSVPQGIIGLMTRFGMHVNLAYPEGYNLVPDCIYVAERNAKESKGSLEICHSMKDAFKDADVVYPKSWAPFSVMEKRTELLKQNDQEGLLELEKACLAQNARYKDWCCTEESMKVTKNGHALYMHCLPADITGVSCQDGEVDSTVFERYRIDTYKEAGFKPFVIAAMILSSRFEDPIGTLEGILSRGSQRLKTDFSD